MRALMVKVDKVLGNYFGAFFTRLTDEEKVNKFVTETLPVWEQVCTESNGKYLMGKDELTLADTHLGAMWESAYSVLTSKGLEDRHSKIDVRKNAPNWCAYMERLHQHPSLKPYLFNQEAQENVIARLLTGDQTVKPNLSLNDIAVGFPSLVQKA